VLTTSASYALIAANLPRSLRTVAARPQVARETDYYLAHIGDVKSIDDFLNNRRLFAYAMKAFGLQDMTYAKGFMRKVLAEGVENRDSFANRLTDARYREFASAFNFASRGAAATTFESARQGTVDRYIRQTLEETAGQQNEGVRLALYFARKAPGITSAFAILADPALLKVVQTVLRLPALMSAMDIDRQADLIRAQIHLADLNDPDKLAHFLSRFTALWDIDHPSSAPVSPAVSFSQPLELGINANLLASLQNLQFGGP
jgi:hypothetical protein